MSTNGMTTHGRKDSANDLEERFGDPYDEANPFGHAAIVAADERAELPDGAEAVLDEVGLNAEFVPERLGGRLTEVDALVRRLRPVFRRDAALGLGYGVTSFMAGLNVWLGGSDVQRKWLADALLGNGKVSVGYHELGRGNDLTGNEFSANRTGDSLILNGRKEVINNAGRAVAAVLFARTDTRGGGRDHSLLLVDLTRLDQERFRRLPRYRTLGLRGCALAGFEFDGCAVPDSALVGEVGAGPDLALRSFQVSRAVMAGAGLGILDAGLFGVLRFALDRRLYGRTVAELPHARSTLAGAYADLLTADAMVTAVTRALHVLPASASACAAAAKYLVPLLLEDAMNALSVILGARFYLREGEYAGFGKHMRDLPPLGIGHAGGVSCQLTILPQLPRLLRGTGDAAPAAVFDTAAPLPELDLAKLRLFAPAGDPLLAVLRDDGTPPAIAAELAALTDAAAAMSPRETGVAAGPAALALTERYALLLAAAAVLGQARHGDAPEGWAELALDRLAERLRPSAALPVFRPDAEEALFGDLVDRAASGVGFCLDRDLVHRSLAP
ncbi:acyl-CoA dehydrogenase [Actinokineospora iranica]|uniref:Acyl-CoA dehydrogenase n=1 Tax=Actinokineospora iranica TaxID=1271860 RepID=A0A1G6Z1H0_9PSEU|nr:acyl-CoA dehydrogenase [Actinokineospora iranica]SDD96594.1 Acyl-CoA dehydrogenase [Actinokineospora iranica]